MKREELELLDSFELEKLVREARAAGMTSVELYYGCDDEACCGEYLNDWFKNTVEALAKLEGEKK